MNTLTVRNAIVEIKRLRRHNEFMNARLQMFDDMMLLLRTRTDNGIQCMGEDICWQLENEIEADEQSKKGFKG